MEFGPRALGNRSILADPRSEMMQKVLNVKIKFRESFRPFAPSILLDSVSDYFEYEGESPYMLMVAQVKEQRSIKNLAHKNGFEKLYQLRSELPAITHVDYSARIQTVKSTTNPRFYALISAFKDLTGVPVVINTSFNVRGEPIVSSPDDAYRCFMRTNMDVLVIGNHVFMKKDQPEMPVDMSWQEEFELD
jgi:carbamoyltransferase